MVQNEKEEAERHSGGEHSGGRVTPFWGEHASFWGEPKWSSEKGSGDDKAILHSTILTNPSLCGLLFSDQSFNHSSPFIASRRRQ